MTGSILYLTRTVHRRDPIAKADIASQTMDCAFVELVHFSDVHGKVSCKEVEGLIQPLAASCTSFASASTAIELPKETQ